MDLWAAIADERASILDTFDGLDAAQWDTPTLCGAWTMRRMLGHLVAAAKQPMGGFVLELARARGSFDAAQDRMAGAEAERPIPELLDLYRSCIGIRRSPPGLGPSAPLTDVLLHSLDVRIPLQLPTERPAERYAPALNLLLSSWATGIFVGRGRPRLRWIASDLDWVRGRGHEVHGTMADLALAASGRPARVDALSGRGHAELAAWLAR